MRKDLITAARQEVHRDEGQVLRQMSPRAEERSALRRQLCDGL